MGVNNKYIGKWSEARDFLVHQKGSAKREGKSWNLRHMVLLRGGPQAAQEANLKLNLTPGSHSL